jgi:hypothetical protein
MGIENEHANQIANAVAEAVSDATATLPPVEGKKEEKLDAQAELFIRRITDSVTKSLADLLKPAVSESDDDEDSPARRKRRAAPKPESKAKPTFFQSLGLG